MKEHVFAPYCDPKVASDNPACVAACRRLGLAWTADVLPLPMPHLSTSAATEPEEPVEGGEEAIEPQDDHLENEDGEHGTEDHLVISGDEEADVS